MNGITQASKSLPRKKVLLSPVKTSKRTTSFRYNSPPGTPADLGHKTFGISVLLDSATRHQILDLRQKCSHAITRKQVRNQATVQLDTGSAYVSFIRHVPREHLTAVSQLLTAYTEVPRAGHTLDARGDFYIYSYDSSLTSSQPDHYRVAMCIKSTILRELHALVERSFQPAAMISEGRKPPHKVIPVVYGERLYADFVLQLTATKKEAKLALSAIQEAYPQGAANLKIEGIRLNFYRSRKRKEKKKPLVFPFKRRNVLESYDADVTSYSPLPSADGILC